jgi:hypothetical protein
MQVRVREEDVHKTTFHTHDGLMEWIAMPFDMWNAQATFQRMMNAISATFTQICCRLLHRRLVGIGNG